MNFSTIFYIHLRTLLPNNQLERSNNGKRMSCIFKRGLVAISPSYGVFFCFIEKIEKKFKKTIYRFNLSLFSMHWVQNTYIYYINRIHKKRYVYLFNKFDKQ